MAQTDDWALAIDFGTSYTAAAVARDGKVEVLEIDGSPRMPSLVLVGEEGELIVGRAAEQQAPLFPGRVERAPKRYLGVPRPLLIDGAPVRAVEVVGRILEVVMTEARRRRGGSEPSEVVLTHPARWADTRLEALIEAAAIAGIHDPSLVPEPVAAARYFAEGQVEVGAYVAVYDLGGGTFDTAVLRRTAGGYELAGAPGGQEDLGGEAFDDRIFRYFGGHLEPEAWEQIQRSEDRRWRQARAAMRNQSREAKEALSRDQSYTVAIPLPVDAQVRITRGELEDLIRFDLKKTVAELADTIRGAGLAPDDVAAIYLVGGSSRVPVVTRLLSETFGRLPTTWDDPKAVVSLGAAKSTAAAQGREAAVPVVAEATAAAALGVAGIAAMAGPADAAGASEVAAAEAPTNAGAAGAPTAPVEELPAAAAVAAGPTADGGAASPPTPPPPSGDSGFMLGSLGPAHPRRRRVALVAPLVGLAAVLVVALVAFGAAGIFGPSPAPSVAVVSPSATRLIALVTPTPSRSASPTPSASPSASAPTASPSPVSKPAPTPAPLKPRAGPTPTPAAKPKPKPPVVTPPPPPPPANHAPVRKSACATVSVNAAGVFTQYTIWIQTAGCFSDPDGDRFTVFANQPGSGDITAASSSNCDPGQTCWFYHPPSGWDGAPYTTTFKFYAKDTHGAKSANGTYSLCVNC